MNNTLKQFLHVILTDLQIDGNIVKQIFGRKSVQIDF